MSVPNIVTSSPLYVKAMQADELKQQPNDHIALLLILTIIVLFIVAITTSVYIFKGKQAINYHLQ